MAESKLYRARVQMVEAMEQGLPWDEAAKQAELQISQSTAYRLRQRMRQGGKQALAEVSPQYRACLLLQDVAGFKQREIATLLNMKEKNVSVYVRRGCEQFSAAYQWLEHGQTDPKKRRSSR